MSYYPAGVRSATENMIQWIYTTNLPDAATLGGVTMEAKLLQ